jgi:two-component system chemotaxis sensor kinase CheA
MNTDIEYYRRQFYQEAREILETLSESVLRLEINPEDRELINSIFRGIHTIKGSAGSFGLDDISSFSHYFEGVLSLLRDDIIKVNSELIDLILAGIDHLLELVVEYENGSSIQIDNSLMERFKAIMNKKETIKEEKESKKEIEQIEESIPEELTDILKKYHQDGLSVYKIVLKYDSDTFRNGYDPAILLKNIRDASSYYKAYTTWQNIPKISDLDPFEIYLFPTVYIATNLPRDEIKSLAFDESLLEVKEISSICEEEPIENQEELFKEFLAEIPEMLVVLESSTIDYEKTGSRDALNSIFRVVHTIKGDSSYLGLKELSEFTHTFESFLEKLRSGEFQGGPEYIDVILKAIDDLKGMISSLSSNKKISMPSSKKIILEYLSGKTKEETPKIDISDEEWGVFIFEVQQYEDILSTYIKSQLDGETVRIIRRAIDGLRKLFRFFNFHFIEDLFDRALEFIDGEDYTSLLDTVKDIIRSLIEVEEDPDRYRAGKVVKKEEEKIAQETPQVVTAPHREEITSTEPKEQPREQQIGVLRIEERKIDLFSNLIGELIIARNTYEYLLGELSVSVNMSQSLLKTFKDNFYLISRLTNEINQNVALLRMVPLKGVFSRFTRVIRDISRKENKKIKLITDGEDIEVDKKIADILSEPLIHLVRNACDHGIETPEERINAGKPEEGTVILRASQEGTNLIIKVIDDGRGMDRNRIYQKAISLGLEAPPSIDDPNLFNLIFLPGFSTKEEVTDISGRGVGMDVVRNAITSLGGKIDINSKEGDGTEITLTIPTSIGVTLALMVEMNNGIYAIPMEYIVETMKLPIRNLRKLHDRIGFYYRGDVLPLEKLDTLLDGRRDGYKSIRDFIGYKDETDEIPLVIIRVSEGKYGIVVDKLLRNMEITIKPMPDAISSVDMFNGVSISGDGRIILVLNPEKLV